MLAIISLHLRVKKYWGRQNKIVFRGLITRDSLDACKKHMLTKVVLGDVTLQVGSK